MLEDEDIAAVAKKNGVSPATVLISYQVNRGVIVLPKSVTAARIEQNLKVVALPKEDMDLLNSMAANGKQKRVNTPAWRSDLVSGQFLPWSPFVYISGANAYDMDRALKIGLGR